MTAPQGMSPRPAWKGAGDAASEQAVVGGVGEGGETAEEWLDLELSKVWSSGVHAFDLPVHR